MERSNYQVMISTGIDTIYKTVLDVETISVDEGVVWFETDDVIIFAVALPLFVMATKEPKVNAE